MLLLNSQLKSSLQLRTSPVAKKKADVAEHLRAFHHVGLLTDEPPGSAELLSI